MTILLTPGYRLPFTITALSILLALSISSRAETETNKAAPQINQLQLQLVDDNNAVLVAKADETKQGHPLFLTRSRGNTTNDPRSFNLNLGNQTTTFNDEGTGADTKKNDGLFTAKVPISITKLEQLNTELADVKQRTLPKFSPGDRVVTGNVTLTDNPIDIASLKAGKVIDLPNAGIFGPLKTLGGTGIEIDPKKSLIITSLKVIEDPARTVNPCTTETGNNAAKVWTFAHLMEQMAKGSGLTPSEFVEDWLNHWRRNQDVAGDGGVLLDSVNNVAKANIDELIINPWRERSGGGALDLNLAPFRLNAILYRPDLAASSPYGDTNNGGELRFVFGMMKMSGKDDYDDESDEHQCEALEAAVIFEYGVPISDCSEIKSWANKWSRLSSLELSSRQFNRRLEKLTQAVVMAGSAPGKPNRNALNQLRTNEISLSNIWQFREFVLTSPAGALRQTTTKNQPREHEPSFRTGTVITSTDTTPTPVDLNRTGTLLNEIIANKDAIIAGTYKVPELSAGLPFLGGTSSYNITTFWDHPDLSSESELDTRFKFSKNTCSGCHTTETGTDFYHVHPVAPGNEATLSRFLQGPIKVMDPSNDRTHGNLEHSFDEIGNRTQALSSLSNQTCGAEGLPPFELLRQPLNSVH